MQSLVNDVIDLFAYTCNMADRESEKLGVKAFSVLKKGFTKLLDLPPGEICDFLYADDVITLEELENATNKHHSTKDRCRKLIVSLKRAAKRDHEHFERFCDYLIKENPSLGYSTMAAAMKGKVYNYQSVQSTEAHKGKSLCTLDKGKEPLQA